MYVWTRFSGIPVWWPAQVVEEINNKTCYVYVQSDDAIMKVATSKCKEFPGDLESLKHEGIGILERKKLFSTLTKFLDDIEWALDTDSNCSTNAEAEELEETVNESTELDDTTVERTELGKRAIDRTDLEKTAVERPELDETTSEMTELEKTQTERTKLEKTKIEMTELKKPQIEMTELEETTSEMTELEETTSEMTELEETQIDMTELEKTQIERTELEETQIERTELEETQIERTELKETQIERTKLEKTQIERTELENTQIERTELENTQIERTELEETQIERTELEKTQIERTELEETQIERTELEKTPIERTELEETQIQRTKLEETQIERTELEKTQIERTELENTQIERTKLENTQIERTKLEKTQIERTELENTQIERTELENTQIERTELEETQIERTELEETQIERTKLEKTQIERTELENTQIERTKLEKIQIESTELEETQIERTELEETQIERTKLEKTQIERTKLENTQIERTKLEKTQIERTELENTQIERTELENTQIERTELEETQIERTELEETQIERTKLEKTQIERTELENTQIERTKLEKIQIERTELEETQIERKELEETQIERTELEETQIQRTKLEETQIKRTELEDTLSKSTELEKTAIGRRALDEITSEMTGLEETVIGRRGLDEITGKMAELELTAIERTKFEERVIENTELEETVSEGTEVEIDIVIEMTGLEEMVSERAELEETAIGRRVFEDTMVKRAELEETAIERTELEETASETTEVEKTVLESKDLEESAVERTGLEETTSDTTDKTESPAITVQVLSQCSGRDYKKHHECYFCGKPQIKMARHLMLKHVDEPDIAKLPDPVKKPGTSEGEESNEIESRRRKVLDKYRNMGDFTHNVEVLRNGKGILFIGRRPMPGKNHEPKDYLPCQFCLVFYRINELWRHTKTCTFRKNKIIIQDEEREKHGARDIISVAKMLLQGALGLPLDDYDNDGFFSNVINAMHCDEVSRTVKSDTLILLLGQTQYSKLGSTRSCQVREKLRIMGRLKLILRHKTGEVSTAISDFIVPEYFDRCISAVRNLAVVSDEVSLAGTKIFHKPAIALKAGHLLKKLAGLKRGQALRTKDMASKEAADDFLALYKDEWADTISAIAHQTLAERRFNTQTILPLTADLIKLTQHVESVIESSTRALLEDPVYSTWRRLAEYTLTRLICFNKRRAEEPAKMLITKFRLRPNWKNANIELVKTLQPLERCLMQSMDLVEVLGKQNRKVPVLLTKSMVAALEALILKRADVGIPASNPYVLARGEDTHLRGCECLKRTCSNCDLTSPHLITSTRMRKYMATVSQVFNLSNMELEELARHMGHELGVHRAYYRLQEDVTELAKISKLLLTVEQGKAHAFHGMNLDDIRLDDLVQDGVVDQNMSDGTEHTSDVLEENDMRESECSSTEHIDVHTSTERPKLNGVKAISASDLANQRSGPAKRKSVDNASNPANRRSRSAKRKSVDNASECSSTEHIDVDTSTDRPKRKCAKSVASNCRFRFESGSEDDDGGDDDEDDDDTDNDLSYVHSTSHAPIRETRKTIKRTTWSGEERDAIKTHLILIIQRQKKPPTKPQVLRAKSLAPVLSNRTWTSIKYQSWAIWSQQEKKRKETMTKLGF